MVNEEPKAPEEKEKKRKFVRAARQVEMELDKKVGIREAIEKAAADHELTPAQIRNLIALHDVPADEDGEKPEQRRPQTEEEVQEKLQELKNVRDDIRTRRAASRAELEKKYKKGPLVQLTKGAAPTFIDDEGNVYFTMANANAGKLPVGGSNNFGNRETGPQWKKWLGKDRGWVEATEDDVRKESEHPTLVQIDSSDEGKLEVRAAPKAELPEPDTSKEQQKDEKPYTDAELANAKENLTKTLDSLGDFPDRETVRVKIADAKTPDDIKNARDRMQPIVESLQKPDTKKVSGGKDPLKKRVPPSEPLEGAPGVYAAKVPEGATWHQTPSGWVIRNQDGTVIFATPGQVKFREEMLKKEQEITDQRKEADKRFEEQQKAIADQLQKATRSSFEKPPKPASEIPKAPNVLKASATITVDVPVTGGFISWRTIDKKKYEGIQILPLESIVKNPEYMPLFYDLLDSIDPKIIKAVVLGKVLHGEELAPEEKAFLEYGRYEFSKWYARGEALAKSLARTYRKEDVLKFAMKDPVGFEKWEGKVRPGFLKSLKNWFTS